MGYKSFFFLLVIIGAVTCAADVGPLNPLDVYIASGNFVQAKEILKPILDLRALSPIYKGVLKIEQLNLQNDNGKTHYWFNIAKPTL